MKRVGAIDALRGITIFAMILCACIGYNSNLPAWMFHCQEPPMFGYAFHPEVRGITWVDLVFPFFIFSMGAAIPFSLGRKLERGESLLKIALSIAKRWAVLMAFAIVLGNADAVGGPDISPEMAGGYRVIVWLALFAALVRTDHKWINPIGYLAVAGTMLFKHFVLGIDFDPRQNDCIIRLLATASLWGSFIWLFTRGNRRLRVLVFLLVIALKLLGQDYLQYLVILIPATIVGDVLRFPRLVNAVGARPAIAALIALLTVFVQLWGLFTRHIVADLCISIALGGAFVLLTRQDRSSSNNIGWMGYVLLIAGVVFDPLDGGIAKDFCNMSYLLTTGGMASLVLHFLMWTESRRPLCRAFTMTGQNPMLAYKIAFYVIVPLLSLCGAMGWMYGLAEGNPFWGIMQGLIVSALMVVCTCIFTKYKIFWRS